MPGKKKTRQKKMNKNVSAQQVNANERKESFFSVFAEYQQRFEISQNERNMFPIFVCALFEKGGTRNIRKTADKTVRMKRREKDKENELSWG